MSTAEQLLLKRMLRVETILNVDRVISSKFEDVLNDESLFESLGISGEIDWKSKRGLECKSIGISALQVFVKQNWFFADVNLSDAVRQYLTGMENITDICKDDETIYSKTRLLLPHLLSIAHRFLVVDSMKTLGDFVWHFRCLYVNQMVLKDASARLYNSIQACAQRFDDYIDDFGDNYEDYESKLMFLQSCVELSQIFLLYKDVHNSDKYLKKAFKFSEVSFKLSGAMGKRTKFQIKPTSQLTVEINREILREVEVNAEVLMDPKNVALEDETLLKNVEFMDANEKAMAMFPEEQLLMLAFVNFSLKSGPHKDILIEEESLTFLECIIRETRSWSLRYKALHLRCLLEEQSKKLERTMVQLNELVDCYRNASQRDIDKLDLFYGAAIEPIWMMEKCFADLLFKMGSTKQALDVYLKLNLWESIVCCYFSIGRKDRAESIVREQLEIERTPDLLCLLGDITEDLSLYDEAWTLSNNRCSRSKKCIGDYYFEKKEYEKCLDPYQISLELNCLQLNTWQRLGYAALEAQNYELSAKAYRRFLQFEYDTYEAWNNLAKVYIKLNDKPRAWKTLQEALKCNFEEWRIWENYLFVSIDVGAFDEVISSWHRLIDLKGKFHDDQVLEILTKVDCGEVHIESDTFNSDKYREKLRTLFGRIAAVGLCSSTFWKLYAKILMHRKNNEDCDKVINCLKKAYQCTVSDNEWQKSALDIEQVLMSCIELMERYCNCCEIYSSNEALKAAINSFRLNLNSVLKTVNMSRSYWESNEKRNSIESLLTEVNNKLNNLLLSVS